VQAFPARVWSKPIDLAAPSQDPGFNLKGRYRGRMLTPQKSTKPARVDQSIAIELG
jgi:hypothetical protein